MNSIRAELVEDLEYENRELKQALGFHTELCKKLAERNRLLEADLTAARDEIAVITKEVWGVDA